MPVGLKGRKMAAELTRRVLTLLFVRDGDRLLLGYKKNGFGKGKWNGFGGKVKDGETVEAAAIRLGKVYA